MFDPVPAKPLIQPSMSGEVDQHNTADLIYLFNALFAEVENTQLVLGGDEPLYQPAGVDCDFHQVIFAHGFFSSALHEIAHWCVAGAKRRLALDYGYWYAPDGRTEQQQAAFEQVEVKPQALEWIFSKACDKKFRVSVDNLSGVATDSAPFKRAVHRQVLAYAEQGLPLRAQLLLQRLAEFYGVNIYSEKLAFNVDLFALSELA